MSIEGCGFWKSELFGANSQNFGTDFQESLLYTAVIEGKKEHIKLLLRYGATPNPEIGKKHHSIGRFSELRKIHHRAIKGEKPNLSTKTSGLPLHAAIRQEDIDTIKLLLRHGASMAQKDEDGFDAIGIATCLVKKLPNHEIVQVLVDHGADINTLQSKDDTLSPLMFACQRNDAKSVSFFIELGANPNQVSKLLALFFDQGYAAPITPFQKAVTKRNTEIISYLLKQTNMPLTFSNIANACAFQIMENVNNIYFAEPDFAIGIAFEPNSDVQKIFELLVQAASQFTEKAKQNEVKNAFLCGNDYYKQRNYFTAMLYFFTCIAFDAPKNRQKSIYNLGCCALGLKIDDHATCFFTAARNFDEKSKIGQNAIKQLAKLEAKQAKQFTR